MKTTSAHKTFISIALSSLFISPSIFAEVIFDNPNQDYVNQAKDLIVNGGESTLNSRSVDLGGGSLQVKIDSASQSQGYSGTLFIQTGDFTANRIRTYLETSPQNSINYETSIIANGTTNLGSIDINSVNQFSNVSQKFHLSTNFLNINSNNTSGISLSASPEGENPLTNHQLEANISAQSVNIHSEAKQALYVDGVGITTSATLTLTGEDIALSGGHSYAATYADNIAVYASQAGSITINVTTSLDVQTKQIVDASDGAFCGNVALYAKTGHIEVNGEKKSSVSTSGGLVAFGENAFVGIYNLDGSKTKINGNINALVGGTVNIKAGNNTLINSESIYVQNGLIDIDVTSEDGGSIGGIRGALGVEYGDSTYGNSDIRVKLSGTSNHFIGTSQIIDDKDNPHSAPEFNHINLTLENGATWDVQTLGEQNNYVSVLTLNNGFLNLRYGEDGSSYKTLDINTLSGNDGLILVNAELTEDKEVSNRVEIQTAKAGTHRIHVNSASGTEPTKLEQDGYLVRVINDEGATFIADNNKLEYGVYFKDYSIKNRLNENNETEWFLTFDPQPEPDLTPSGEAVVALAGMGAQNAMYLNQLSDVRKRLGEIRNGVKDGIWASVAAQKDQISGFSSTSFDQEAYRFNFGFDRSIGQWLVGANIKAVTANQETKNTEFKADGDAHSEGINLYATWYNEIGCYADLVLSLDRYHQEIENRMLSGTKVKGSYHNLGLGVSVEGGRKFSLGGDKSWFIEPQAQLSYYWMKGDDFSMSNAMEVKQEDFDSLTGRLGVVAGRDFIDSLGNNKGQLYARLGVNHEFLGDQAIRVNNIRFSDDLLGTRVYYGLAGEWSPYENIKLFGYVERENGSDYTKEIEISAGIKYTF